jgi:cytochrome c5
VGFVITETSIATETTNTGKDKIDAKRIIETVCTKCHNINRIVYSPDRDVRDWVQIIAFANRKGKFITKEEMVAVIEWLQVNHKELKPAPVDIDELTKGFDPGMKEFLVKNKCILCHTGDRIQQKAGLLSAQEWQGIISRMKLKGPDLLKGTNTDKAAEYLSNVHIQIPDDIAESVQDTKDKLNIDELIEEAFTAEFNPKQIVNSFCIKCHNINRIAYSPKRGHNDWLKILSSDIKMDQKIKNTLSRDEIVEVCNFLSNSNQELEPVQVDTKELTKNLDPETGNMLIKNYCLDCHTGDRIIKKMSELNSTEWEHVVDRMYTKAPGLLKDIDKYDLATHLYDQYLSTKTEKGARKGKGIFKGLYYKYSGSIDIWGEVRDNYDFNDKTSSNTSAARRFQGLFEGKSIVRGELFDPDRWKLNLALGGHLLHDRGNRALDDNLYRRERNDVETDFALEESWLQVAVNKKFGINVRTGIQDYKSDLIGSIYSDTDLGVRVTGTYEGIDWSLYGANRIENDLLSDFNQISSFRDQQIYIAHLQFNIGKTIVKPSIHFNIDDEGDHRRGRVGRDENVEALYVGFTTYGPIGPVNLLTGLYGVFGNQDNVSLVGAIPLRDQNVRAFVGYLDVSYPMLNGKITPHIGGFYASGDNDPFDGDATGFDAISDRVNVWGSKGFMIGDRVSLGALGGRTVMRQNSPYTALRDTDANSNFVNPGAVAVNIGLNTKPFDKLSLDTNFTQFWWRATDSLEAIMAALGTPNNLGNTLGFELNMEANYKLTDKLNINASGTIYKTHQEMRKIYGDNDLLTKITAGIQFNF